MMKKEQLRILIMILLLIPIFIGCNSKYDKLIEEYDSKFKGIVAQIDPKEISESIKDNELESQYEELDALFNKIAEEDIPNDKISDMMILREQHSILKEVIEKGIIWETLKEIEKLALEDSIEVLISYK
jgi:PBP1b-binding outer membrane lipoprotein LpoB